MKKKNLLVLGVAAALCMIAVLLLLGSMGVYAERFGTEEFVPEMEGSETSDMLAKILIENSETEAEGTMSEEELKELWDGMYTVFSETKEFQQKYEERQESANVRIQEMKEISEGEPEDLSFEDSRLTVQEAGMIFMKEINRLYPKDILDGFMLSKMWLIHDIGYNNQNYLEWQGCLENGENTADENYVSYKIEIDAISGKIMGFTKFHPYQKEKDYSKISWTDEQIVQHAKELIEKYHLADAEELDWSNLELYNGKESLEGLREEIESGASASVDNMIIFGKNEKRYFLFSTDWETGQISSYIWAGRHLPE